MGDVFASDISCEGTHKINKIQSQRHQVPLLL